MVCAAMLESVLQDAQIHRGTERATVAVEGELQRFRIAQADAQKLEHGEDEKHAEEHQAGDGEPRRSGAGPGRDREAAVLIRWRMGSGPRRRMIECHGVGGAIFAG